MTAGKTSIHADEAQPVDQLELRFDAKNPRLKEHLRDVGSEISQDDIVEVLWREFAVDEIAFSIASNGFFRHETLFATRENGELVVIEGNRRLAAVRLLTDPHLRRLVGASDLPKISPRNKETVALLPVIECSRVEIWQYIGFKHVNGPLSWQSLAKAEYIAWVHNETQVPLQRIANQIGDQHATVKRLYRANMAIEQAEHAGVFDRRDRWRKHFSFSHLYPGLDYANMSKFTGISGEGSYEKRRPIPKSKLKQFGELCEWLYGSKSKNQPPAVRTQNPDLRLLDEVLGSKNGIAALRRGLPLKVSLDISKGDERLFREALVTAKQSLQDARGKVLSGYAGEPDLLSTADDIQDLASDIYNDMAGVRRSKRRRKRAS